MIYVPLEGNSQKLDGGAMFGNAPRALWSKWLEPDDENRVTLATRALLIQENNRNVLLETGIGAFFEPKMRERFGIEKEHVLLSSLKKIGLTHEDIDVVVLSHLHFDHAGGLLSAWEEGKQPQLLFPNAKYLVGKKHWERALKPHQRDKASFIPGLTDVLEASGRLELVDHFKSDTLGDHYSFHFTDGHTPGLMHTIVKAPKQHPLVFASDLIPGTPWVHLPITMGYDRAPEQLINEKKYMLEEAIANQAKLFYTHDPRVVMSHVEKDDDGRFSAVKEMQSI